MLAILLLCLVAATFAQRPQPCITPSQWEGRVFDFNEKENFMVRGLLSYDAVNHRERFIDEIDEGSQQDFFDSVALFDLQTEFIYNFRARNCTRRPITRPWRDFGIRSNDTSYGEAYIGSSAVPGANILATIWGGNFTTPTETVSFISTWAFLGCVPLVRTTFSRSFGISHTRFFDITLGIRDPNVFIPRRECLSADEWENRYTLFGTPIVKHN